MSYSYQKTYRFFDALSQKTLPIFCGYTYFEVIKFIFDINASIFLSLFIFTLISSEVSNFLCSTSLFKPVFASFVYLFYQVFLKLR